MDSFTKNILEKAEQQPIQALVDLCRSVIHHVDEEMSTEWNWNDHDVLMEAVALIETIIEANSFEIDYSPLELSGEVNRDCSQMLQFIREAESKFQLHASQAKMELYKSKFHTSLGSSFAYEFSQGDLERLQTLINELRSQISASTLFEEPHKARLLKRLEAMQAELHKKVSDIDKFYGLLGDAGVVLGKFGVDAKPLVDRMKEIAQIGWRTQARAEELPSDSHNPLLEHDEPQE